MQVKLYHDCQPLQVGTTNRANNEAPPNEVCHRYRPSLDVPESNPPGEGYYVDDDGGYDEFNEQLMDLMFAEY